MQYLHPNTTLQGGKYKIIKVLGQGGFGITYQAKNIMLDGMVAIKEFFLKEYCDRDEHTSCVTIPTSGNREIVECFKQKFIKEARTIFKLNHPNIVRILDIFEENGTAYYVMDYIEGESLGDLVKYHGAIPETEAINYIKEAGNALTYIHGKSINHLDIKPANLMKRREDGRILVIDFGVAKQYDAATSEGTTTTPVGISKGYSPNEQYMLGGVQSFSPQSDVYALAATLYKLLTGVTPPEAALIIEDGLPIDELNAHRVTPKTTKAIEAAMRSRRQRTQSVELFLLSISSTANSISKTNNDEVTVVHSGAENVKNFSDTVVTDIGKDRYSGNENIKTFTVNGVSYDMILVQCGSFTMGATPEMKDPWDDEKPTHDVTLTNNFHIGKTPVTQAFWKAVMGNNPSHFKGDNKPVESVSWNDCKKFILKLNSITGMNFRLPTEAEWEFAARGCNNSKHYQYSGSNELDNVAWYSDNSGSIIHDVATKQPNELGIYDMSGNVWEWCSDYWGNYSGGSQTNPTGPNSGSYRVRRGGCWYLAARYCCSSFRDYSDSDFRSNGLGLRLALSE